MEQECEELRVLQTLTLLVTTSPVGQGGFAGFSEELVGEETALWKGVEELGV